MNNRIIKNLSFPSREVTPEAIYECLQFMTPKNRKIFESRWGLDESGIYCPDSVALSKKMGVPTSWSLYRKAASEFDLVSFKRSYAILFEDYLQNFDKAFCYGTFIARLLGPYCHPQQIKPLNLSVEEMEIMLDKAFKSLTELERNVLEVKYGLKDSICIKMDSDVAAAVEKSESTVVKAERRAIKKLRKVKALSIIKG